MVHEENTTSSAASAKTLTVLALDESVNRARMLSYFNDHLMANNMRQCSDSEARILTSSMSKFPLSLA